MPGIALGPGESSCSHRCQCPAPRTPPGRILSLLASFSHSASGLLGGSTMLSLGAGQSGGWQLQEEPSIHREELVENTP